MDKKIIDCFLFYTELDMLQYRLSVLNDYVDYFVLVEATHTFSGKQKQLLYNENKNRFEKYKDKIIHLIVYDMPFQYPNINYDLNQQWLNEAYQRNCLKYGIDVLKLQDSDVIIISDVDEIPDTQILSKIKTNDLPINFNSLEQDMYYYNLNIKHNDKWYFSKILNYKKYNEMNLTVHDIRMNFGNNLCVPIKNGGWHLSYFGTEENIKSKIMDFSHQELNTTEFTDVKKIKERINKGIDLFDRGIKITNVPIEENNYLPPSYNLLYKNNENKNKISAIYNCYSQLACTNEILIAFRKFYPENKVLLINDNGNANYLDIAKRYNCDYYYEYENIGYPGGSETHFQILKWLKRFLSYVKLIDTEWFILLEDDVLLLDYIDFSSLLYDVNGIIPVNIIPYTASLILFKYFGRQVNPSHLVYGATGGTIFRTEFFKNMDINIVEKYVNLFGEMTPPSLTNQNWFYSDVMLSYLTYIFNGSLGKNSQLYHVFNIISSEPNIRNRIVDKKISVLNNFKYVYNFSYKNEHLLINNKYSIIIPTIGEGETFELFITHSLPLYKKYLNMDDVYQIFICCPERNLDSVIQRLSQFDFPFVFLKDEDFNIINDRWINQQIIKLSICHYINTEHYLILDDDMFLTKKIQFSDFFDKNGNIYYSFESSKNNQMSLTNSCIILNYDINEIKSHQDIASNTSQLMITRIVRQLLQTIGNSWEQYLKNYSTNSFLLYWIYLLKSFRTMYYIPNNNNNFFNKHNSNFLNKNISIHISPFAGIGNILKGFISFLSINENTKIEYNNNYMLGDYQNVFDNKHIIEDKDNINYYHLLSWRFLILKEEENNQKSLSNEYSYDFKLVHNINEKINLFSTNVSIDSFYNRKLISDNVYERIMTGINRICWNKKILIELDKLLSTMTYPSLGISVRTWEALHEVNVGRKYSFEEYKIAINKFLLESKEKEKEIKTIFISYDNHKDELLFLELFKGFNVIIYNKPDDISLLQYGVIKMLLLSKCNYFICNRISTYSELVYWFSGCSQNVIDLF